MVRPSELGSRWAAPALAVAAWLVAAGLHGQVPRDPSAPGSPGLPVLAVLSAGRPAAAAALAWSGVVLHHATSPAPDPEALAVGIGAAVASDPGFRPPMAHGALLLRRAGRSDLAVDALELGLRHHPADPWFPWALGMIAWVDRGERDAAAGWLERAERVTCPGCAPGSTVHGSLAARLRSGR